MKFPRVLVVSNNCFSKTNSNGRTLGNFFVNWPKNSIAQFCLGLTDPNYDVCDNYYCVTDKAAMRSILKGAQRSNRAIVSCDTESTAISNKSSHTRTSYLLIARYLIWRSNAWRGKDFWSWLEEFKPEMIMFQSGESAFMAHIVVDLANHYDVPLVVYNSEGYYFFKKNYVGKHWSEKLFFPILRWINNKEYKRLMKRLQYSFYLNDQLKSDYDAAFNVPSSVIYTSSDMQYRTKEIAKNPTFSYIGNFGFDRPKALLDVAKALNTINKEYKLNVYGAHRDNVTEILEESPYVNFHGRIGYDDVQKVMYASDILFHVESKSEQYEESLRYGFSTKIADSISCGTNFLLYAPRHIACAKYIIETNAAWYAETFDELVDSIKTILQSDSERMAVSSTAKKIAVKNHDMSTNSKLFKETLMKIYFEYGK